MITFEKRCGVKIEVFSPRNKTDGTSDHMMSRPSPTPIYTLRGAAAPLNTLHFSCQQGTQPLLYSG